MIGRLVWEQYGTPIGTHEVTKIIRIYDLSTHAVQHRNIWCYRVQRLDAVWLEHTVWTTFAPSENLTYEP